MQGSQYTVWYPDMLGGDLKVAEFESTLVYTHARVIRHARVLSYMLSTHRQESLFNGCLHTSERVSSQLHATHKRLSAEETLPG